MRAIVCALAITVALAGVSRAQIPEDHSPDNPKDNPLPTVEPPVIEPEAEGLEQDQSLVVIGKRAPSVALEDSLGRSIHLSALKGSWAVLIFTEDHRTLAPFKAIDPGLRQIGVRLYAICQDRAATLKSYADREQLPFELLSDKTGDTFRSFGLYDPGDGVIQPGIALLDPTGRVRMSALGQALHPDEVLQLARHTVTGS